MATKMSVLITDDLDGSPEAKPVRFEIEGTNYEVDLGAKNRAKLEKALAPYIEAGRRRRGTGRRPAASRSRSQSSVDNAAIRAWAKSAGLQVSERGRISADVLSQYQASH